MVASTYRWSGSSAAPAAPFGIAPLLPRKPSLFYATIFAAAAIILAFAAMEWSERATAFEDTYVEARNVSRPLAGNVELLVNAVDRSLLAVRQVVTEQIADVDVDAMHRELRIATDHSVAPLQFVVIGADAHLLATSRMDNPDRINLADRDYFYLPMARQDDAPFVGEPIQSRLPSAEGQWMVPISRPIRNVDGAFGGVSAAMIPLDFMRTMFEGNFGSRGAIGIARRDGTLLVSVQSNEVSPAEIAGDLNLPPEHLEGRTLTAVQSDGERHLVSWKALPETDIVVFTAISEADALDRWTEDLLRTGSLLAAISLLALGAGWVLDRRIIQHAAREAEARELADAAFAGISDPLFVIDDRGRLRLANEAATALGPSEQTLTTILGMVPVAQAASAEGDDTFRPLTLKEIFLPRANVWLAVSCYPFKGGALVYARNVTEQKRIAVQLYQAQKMEVIGQLTGGIAHDFNNLLTVIIGSLESIIEDTKDHPEISEASQRLMKAAENAEQLVRSLLAVGRRQALAPVPTDVNRLVGSLDRMVSRVLPGSIDFRVELSPDLWPAEIDPGQLEGAILNLVINARDAMPEGGALTIETSNEHLDDDYALRHNEVVPGRYVLVAVSDTGSGMSPEVLDRAFDPFFTTKPEGRGSGLGLSMVQGYVKQTGGHIKIYSEIGGGTTIKLYLPRADADALPREIAPTGDQLRGGSETVLLVEDDDLVRSHAMTLIRRLGYTLVLARNAEEALDRLDEETIDLMLTDVMLPGRLNGRHLADLAAREYPHLRTIFMSGYTRNAIIHHGRLDAGVDFLAKPFRMAELAGLLRRVLDR